MNILKFYIQNIVIFVMSVVLGGAILQTVLIEYGMAESTVNIYCSVMQVVQMLVMLMISPRVDRIKNVIGAVAYSILPSLPLTVFVCMLCIFNNISVAMVTILVFAFGLLYNFSQGINQILSYKLPYHIIDMSQYGKILAISGVIGGIVTFVFSTIMSYFQTNSDYFDVIIWCFVITFGLVIVYFVSGITMKENMNTDIEPDKKEKINLFTYRPFYVLALPNLMRGFCLGIINLSVTIGYYEGVIGASSATALVVITNAITILSCSVYSPISKKIGECWMILVASIVVFVSMPMMFVQNSTAFYLGFYAVAYFFIIIINYAVPIAVYRVVDYDVIGQYNAWRLLTNALGIAIAGFVCTPMLDFFGPVLTMIISAGMQLVSGTVYFLYVRKIEKKF